MSRDCSSMNKSFPPGTRFGVALVSAALVLTAGLVPSVVLAAGATPLQEYFAQLHGGENFNGSVLAADRRQIRFHAAYGLADEETRTKLEPNTPHRVASITKGFTAVLALQAAERREIELDGPMLAHFPEVKRADLGAITIRHLLTHSSGLVDFAPEPRVGETVIDALVRALATAKVDFAPGRRAAYINVNYTIVGHLLERATQRSYAKLLQDRILQPAGMTATYLDVGANRDRPRAVGYALTGGKPIRDEERDLTRFIGAGSIVSTTEDLLRFSRALEGDTLLSAESRKLMLTPQKERYAIGCTITSPRPGQTVQVFPGGMTGTSAVLARFNDGAQTIVILSNRSDVPVSRFVPQVQRRMEAAP
jgi:CubicO group peptidase (beta-lactamase class C family)